MKRLLMLGLAILVAIAIAYASICMRYNPWGGSAFPASSYLAPDPSSQPSLVQASQLQPLDGYMSPKPVVAADGEGNVVVIAHAVQDSPLTIDIMVWRSSNRGETWEEPEKVTRMSAQGEVNFDPWIETDGHGHYYTVHTLRSDGRPLIRRSSDAGKTWSDSLPIPWKQCDRPVLGVSPDGKLLVVAGSMLEHMPAASREPLRGNDPDLAAKLRAQYRMYAGVFVSDDFGNSWSKLPSPFGENKQAIPFAVVIDNQGRVAGSWIVDGHGSGSAVSVSENGGRTWENTTLVSSLQHDRPHPFNGERFPVVALDGANTLHVAYVTSGAKGLMIRRSRDWKSWGAPLTLSSTVAEEVRMAAIDACGPMVHVMWMERIGSLWQSYYRGSLDHGVTWSAPCCLSESVVLRDSSVSHGFQIYGDDDQSSLRDDGLGHIHAVWCVRGGKVVHAIIEWTSRSSSVAE